MLRVLWFLIVLVVAGFVWLNGCMTSTFLMMPTRFEAVEVVLSIIAITAAGLLAFGMPKPQPPKQSTSDVKNTHTD